MTLVSGTNTSVSAAKRLFEMHRWMRPNGSETEQKFIDTFIGTLPGAEEDKFGNVLVTVGKDPVVAWSSHTDTVHRCHGFQLISVDDDYVLGLDKASKSNCLGADDTAGVWLMTELIRASRPGLYLFHRAEEVGGKGSLWLAANLKDKFKGVGCVIALDRRDKNSVITFQRGMRCCSNEFGQSLADKIGGKYKLDDGGLYTDSANYTGIVSECTNLSVGYDREHSSKESLDMRHLVWLRDQLIGLDGRDLVYKRVPGSSESKYGNGSYRYTGRPYGDEDYGENWWDHFDQTHHQRINNQREQVDEFGPKGKNYCPKVFLGHYYRNGKYIRCTQTAWAARLAEVESLIAKRKSGSNVSTLVYTTKNVRPAINAVHVISLVKQYPDEVATIFEDWGFDGPGLREEILAIRRAGVKPQ